MCAQAYIYALYREYHFSQRQIGWIFIVGYASSATLGTMLASAGDRYGHKLNVILYGLIYTAVRASRTRPGRETPPAAESAPPPLRH